MENIFEKFSIIGILLLIPAGIFAPIYELFIWDKSIVPDWLYNGVILVGLAGMCLIAIPMIYKLIHKNKSRRKK